MMIKKNIIKESRQQRNTYGLYITMPDISVVEMAAYAGYDFIRIDYMHYLINPDILLQMISIANLVGISVHVRTASLDDVTKVLEAGADGVIIPEVSSKEQAIAAVNAVKFAPLGNRGMYNGYRCSQYGCLNMQDYLDTANDNTVLTIQIEGKEALTNIKDILSVPGIDMVSSGKADLSQSLGYPGQTNHPEVLAAEENIVKTALKHQIYPSILVGSQARLAELQAMGVCCFTIGRDRNLIMTGMTQLLQSFQKKN